MGHQGHPATDRLGTAFFDYALSLREEKRDGGDNLTLKTRSSLPWPASFRKPPFVGDAVNQQVFRADEASGKIPEAFRVNIPTKILADAWLKEK